MNKKLIFFLTSSLLICSCNNTTDVSDNLSNQESSVMESSSIIDTEILDQSSEQESIIDSIEDGGFKGYALNDIIDYDYLEIGVNDSYNIRKSINNEFKDSWMDIYIENTDIALPDVEDNIKKDLEIKKIVLDDSCYLTKPQIALYERILKESMENISKSESRMNRRGAIFKLITNLRRPQFL